MPGNKIYSIVEGHGEADRPGPNQLAAVEELVSKMLLDQGYWNLSVPKKKQPWRMASCGDFYPCTENVIQALDAHRCFPDCAAVLVLFDLDDGLPCEVGPEVARKIQEHGAWPFSIVVVCAHREYESWFLASLETIAPDGQRYEGDPEAIRDPKHWLTRNLGYRQVEHQAAYTRELDVAAVFERSRSFRRLYHAFEQLVAAHRNGEIVVTP